MRAKFNDIEVSDCDSVLGPAHRAEYVNVLALFVYGGQLESDCDLRRVRCAIAQCFRMGVEEQPWRDPSSAAQVALAAPEGTTPIARVTMNTVTEHDTGGDTSTPAHSQLVLRQFRPVSPSPSNPLRLILRRNFAS